MRSRRSSPGRPLSDTKVSSRRVTCKAPLAHLEGESDRSEVSPTAILQGTHSLERLSEKGCEQPSKRGFRWCGDAKMGLKVPFRWSIRQHRRLFRPFSDSLSTHLGE